MSITSPSREARFVENTGDAKINCEEFTPFTITIEVKSPMAALILREIGNRALPLSDSVVRALMDSKNEYDEFAGSDQDEETKARRLVNNIGLQKGKVISECMPNERKTVVENNISAVAQGIFSACYKYVGLVK